jgi:hypothetical protein
MSVARHVGLTAPLVVCLLLASPATSDAKEPAPKAAPAPTKPERAPTKAERAAARDAYDKGTAAFDKGDYAKALDSFVKANAKIPSVQALYWIGQSHDKLGHTDSAIQVYEEISAHADFSKLSEDKQATVRQRLAALKPPPPPPPPPEPAPVVPAPTNELTPGAPLVDPASLPPISEPPPAPPASDTEPAANTVELGVLGGVLFVSDSNNLVERNHAHTSFKTGVGQVGVRAAYFPARALGIEAEWAHGFGVSKAQGAFSSKDANFDALRGHLIAQLPSSRFVPFALLGAGILNGTSKPGGSDFDFLLEAGIGAKLFVTKVVVPRLDLRLNMTQKEGGGFADGVAVHPEILLGVSFRLGK